jgi:two-component system chemotaxis response regulator CheB
LPEIKEGEPPRSRCQIGLALTAKTTIASAEFGSVGAIRAAMRRMDERVELFFRMARDERESGRFAVAELYEARALEYDGYAVTLRRAATLNPPAGRQAGPEDD